MTTANESDFIMRRYGILVSELGAKWVPVLAFVAAAIIFFRWQINSHFDLLFGDRGDAVYVVFINEHIFQSLFGHEIFLSPPFFYNHGGTLGFSDAFVLWQIFYAPLRLFGAGPFLSTSLVIALLSVIAFVFVYLILHRLAKVGPVLVGVATILFVFPNNLYLKSIHMQLFVVYFVPVVVFMAVVSILRVHERPARSYAFAGASALIYALMFSTGFYVAWFFGFLLMIFVPVAVYVSWPQAYDWYREGPRHIIWLVAFAVAGFVAGLIPFVYIYYSVLINGSARSIHDYLVFAPKASDIINVGMWNLVWGAALRASHLVSAARLTNTEFHIAITPTVQVLTIISAILATRKELWPSPRGTIERAIVLAAAIVPFVSFLATIKVGYHTLFEILYMVVPGAKAIRSGYRIMIVANFFAAIAIALAMKRVFSVEFGNVYGHPWVWRITIGVLLGVALVEQVNLTDTAVLSRSQERRLIAGIAHHPKACSSFYVVDKNKEPPTDVQTTAMLLAEAQGIPTLNGYSGIFPRGFNFYNTRKEGYETNVLSWASRRDLFPGVCRLDLGKRRWTVVVNDPALTCTIRRCIDEGWSNHGGRFVINFSKSGNSSAFVGANWSGAEAWGRWTSAKEAELTFSVLKPRKLEISLDIHGLLSPSAPRQRVWVKVNSCRVANAVVDVSHDVATILTGVIPVGCLDAGGSAHLWIDTDRAVTPEAIGINGDRRKLGVAVTKIVIKSR